MAAWVAAPAQGRLKIGASTTHLLEVTRCCARGASRFESRARTREQSVDQHLHQHQQKKPSGLDGVLASGKKAVKCDDESGASEQGD